MNLKQIRRTKRIKLTKEETQLLIDEKIESVEKDFGSRAKIAVLEILTLERSLTETKPKTRFIQPTDWNNYHAKPTLSALRNLISRRKTNGFDRVLKRDGKLWYIDEQKYFEWKENRFEETEEKESDI